MDKLTEFNRCFQMFPKSFGLIRFEINMFNFSVFDSGFWVLHEATSGVIPMSCINPVQPEAEAYGESIELARAISKAGKTTTRTGGRL